MQYSLITFFTFISSLHILPQLSGQNIMLFLSETKK